MDAVRTLSLLAATISMGLMAGVFGLYTHTIMPGLAKTDDRTFVSAFQVLDRAIINPWFLGGGFLGALVFTAVAAFSHIGRHGLPWIISALCLYLVSFVVTFAVNVPLNDRIKAAGAPQSDLDFGAVRRAFDAPRWVRWNLVRTITTSAAFGVLAWALVLLGRATP